MDNPTPEPEAVAFWSLFLLTVSEAAVKAEGEPGPLSVGFTSKVYTRLVRSLIPDEAAAFRAALAALAEDAPDLAEIKEALWPT